MWTSILGKLKGRITLNVLCYITYHCIQCAGKLTRHQIDIIYRLLLAWHNWVLQRFNCTKRRRCRLSRWGRRNCRRSRFVFQKNTRQDVEGGSTDFVPISGCQCWWSRGRTTFYCVGIFVHPCWTGLSQSDKSDPGLDEQLVQVIQQTRYSRIDKSEIASWFRFSHLLDRWIAVNHLQI